MPCKIVRPDPYYQPQQEDDRSDFHDEYDVALIVERVTITYSWWLMADVATQLIIDFPGGPTGFSLTGQPESRAINPNVPGPLIVIARGERRSAP